MSSNISPIPVNEMDRILNLYEFDIDYSNLASTFKDLTHLAAKISGTDISLVNLIDSYTQWSVSNFGLEIDQMAREDSVCQYTILEQDHFEVEDLSADTRFQDKSYVNNPLNLRYYFGVPLKTNTGHHIGALCVLDKNHKKLSDEKIEFLKIIANEIITKLNTIKVVKDLNTKIVEGKELNKRVAHDIRGPIAGIIGLTDIILEDSKEDEILELANMISKSGNAVLDLADEILSPNISPNLLTNDDFNLLIFSQKLEKLYASQAKAKEISFIITMDDLQQELLFKRANLLQIAGNLISNAIKFTPKLGQVNVHLSIKASIEQNYLILVVSDNGLGLDSQTLESIVAGTKKSSIGTDGELGYGFGLTMVRHLVQAINGTLNVFSAKDEGSKFEVIVPI